MCLNKQLIYNIKVRSRTCECYVFNKENFLKLSVNYNTHIEKFLRGAFEKYLKLINDINDMYVTYKDIFEGKKEKNEPVSFRECKSIKSIIYTRTKSIEEINRTLTLETEKKIQKTITDHDDEVIVLRSGEEESDDDVVDRCDRIIKHIERVGLTFDNEENPKEILITLKETTDKDQRRELIDKLENLLTNAIKKYKESQSINDNC